MERLLRGRDAAVRLADVNPVDYLADTLRALLDGHRKARIEELVPWSFAQPSCLAAWGQAAALTYAGLIAFEMRRLDADVLA